MKKIIGGRKYDTSTAKLLASWESDRPKNDFGWYTESLYQKRNGEFFLFGEGGGASPYRQAVEGNAWTYGEKIFPLTYEAAQQWAESNLDADDYEKIFGEVDEGEGEEKKTSFTLSAAAFEKLRRLAARDGVSLSEAVERLISENWQ